MVVNSVREFTMHSELGNTQQVPIPFDCFTANLKTTQKGEEEEKEEEEKSLLLLY